MPDGTRGDTAPPQREDKTAAGSASRRSAAVCDSRSVLRVPSLDGTAEHSGVDGEPGNHSPETPRSRWLRRAERERDITAFEEAGHFVGGWLTGLDVEDSAVTVVPDDLAWGRVTWGGTWLSDGELAEVKYQALLGGFDVSADTRRKLEAVVVSLFTGQLAALRALQEGEVASPPRPHVSGSFDARQELLDSIELRAAAGETGVSDDVSQVKRLTEAVSASPAEAWSYGSWLFHRAETMVRSRPFWLATCAIAERLLAQPILTGQECLALAGEALQPQPLPDTARAWPRGERAPRLRE